MFAFAFPPFPTGVLAAFAFVPLLIVLAPGESLAQSFRSAYLAFLIENAVALMWISGLTHSRDPYLLASGIAVVLVHPLLMTIPVVAFAAIRRQLGLRVGLFSFPFLWVAFEYSHSITEFAFPWLLLGNTQTYDLPAIQFAAITGAYGVSFWLLWINVAAYVLFEKLALGTWTVRSWRSVGLGVGVLALYLLPKLYGGALMAGEDSHGWTHPVKVGMVQPNIDPFEKWSEHRSEQLAVLDGLTNELAAHDVDVIVWPETAMPFYVLAPQNLYILEQLRAKVDSMNTALLTGIPDVHYYRQDEKIPTSSKVIEATGQRYDTFNSSMLVQPHSREIQKYAKIRLVPFAERVPYLEFYPFLETLQWNLGLGGWGIGTDTTVFQLRLRDSATVTFSNLICYESIYPGFVAEFVRKGAQFLTIVTNDSWWGNLQGPYQHQQYAVLRAVENRRWIARCANGGISCLIDPWGRVVAPTKMFTRTVLSAAIEARSERTFYAQHGDVFAQGCLMTSGLLLAAALGQKLRVFIRTRSEIA